MTRRMTGQHEDAMSVFSDAEIEYLGSQRLGRLATVGQDGMPHVVPVAFRYNPDADSIDIGGHDFAKRKKFRDVQRTGVAALVVDDVLPPWQPRAVEVRGEASTLDTGGKAIMEGFDDPIIRITPRRIVSWGRRTASRLVQRLIRTSYRQLRSLVLCVELVCSRPNWPAHVGCLVDLVASGRIPSVRLDDQPDDQAKQAAR
jgi:pyridoxamine 5'-phosphate oxidase family protein